MPETTEPVVYVSPEGSDHWTGTAPEKRGNRGLKIIGPMRTVRHAMLVAREWRRRGRAVPSVRIELRGGRYPITFPLEIGPEDRGLTLAGTPGEEVVFDGSIPLEGGEVSREADGCWSFDVSDVLVHDGAFGSLFVDGGRRRMARFPEDGYLQVKEAPERFPGLENNLALVQGVRRFRIDPEEVAEVGDLTGTRIIILNRWIIERLRIESWNPETGDVVTDRPTRLFLKPEQGDGPKGCRFYLEKLRGVPATPGTWTLDEAGARLLYRPLSGETLESADVRVPVTRQFVRVMGGSEGGNPVTGVELNNLRFRYADYSEPDNRFLWWDPYRPESEWTRRDTCRHFVEVNGADPRTDSGSMPQAAVNVPGALQFEAAEDCAVVDCEVGGVGFYAIGARRGCRHLRLEGNYLHDLGAGGVIGEGTGVDGPEADRTGYLRITDNTIEGTGHVFPAACGVTLVHVHRCVVAHNHIHDLSYSGLSLGWVWGYSESPSYGHLVEKNHIHDVGVRGDLSDMGGIYLLGYQPGTLLRGNFIHDVNRAAYGGWGLYPDEGSSGLTVENNVVARCASECLHEHFGRQNAYRNNIFAHGAESLIRLSPDSRGFCYDFPPQGTTFLRNILLGDGVPVFVDLLSYFREDGPPLFSDLNLYWDESKKDATVVLHEKTPPVPPPPGTPCTHDEDRYFSLAEFARADRDGHSVAADPGFADPANNDFSLPEDSPARKTGFQPIDLSDVGPRNAEDRLADSGG